MRVVLEVANDVCEATGSTAAALQAVGELAAGVIEIGDAEEHLLPWPLPPAGAGSGSSR